MTTVFLLFVGGVFALVVRNIVDAYRAAPKLPREQTGTGAGLPVALLVVRADRDARADISRAIERDDRTRWN